MKTAQQEADDFNRRFRDGMDVDILWNRVSGYTTRETLVGRAGVWQSGEAVVEVEGIGVVLCAAIYMPAGVGG